MSRCLVAALMISVTTSACVSKTPHWDYDGPSGPAHWGTLHEDYALCGEGSSQSPVDLLFAADVGASAPVLRHIPSEATVVNNGRTIRVDLSSGSAIEVDGDRFELLQFHFHTPSEHTMVGAHTPMEIHFVHRNASGRLTVLGVLVEEGDPNGVLGPVWDRMPYRAGESATLEEPVDPSALTRGVAPFLRYPGSLTTPPCSEGVEWFVGTKPISASRTQIERMRDFIGKSNRPTQPPRSVEMTGGESPFAPRGTSRPGAKGATSSV